MPRGGTMAEAPPAQPEGPRTPLWRKKGPGPHRGRTLFTRRSVRRIFRHVHAAAKNDPTSFRRKRRKPGRGPGPFLEFPEDGGPHSAAFSYRWPLLSAWPPSGFGGELRPKVVDETSLTPRRARRPGVPPPVPTSPAKRAASPPPPGRSASTPPHRAAKKPPSRRRRKSGFPISFVCLRQVPAEVGREAAQQHHCDESRHHGGGAAGDLPEPGADQGSRQGRAMSRSTLHTTIMRKV